MPKRKTKASVSPEERGKLIRLGDILPQMMARYGLQRRGNIDRIVEAWASIIAETDANYANVTQVVGFQRGTLEISVPHSAFVQELSFLQADLLARMQAAVPGEKFKKIKFLVSR